MNWSVALSHWETWAIAAFVSALLYAILKYVVPVSKRSKQVALIGVALAERSQDSDFARAGLHMAQADWRRRKRMLLAVAMVSGVGVTALVVGKWPGMLGWPVWVYGASAVASLVVFTQSKY